jgi:peptide chain release factor 1
MSLQHSLDRVLVRHDELRDLLATGTLASDAFMKASKEYAELTPVVEAVNALRACEAQIAECDLMMKGESDPDLRKMAEADWLAQKDELPKLKLQVQRMLLPKDAADERNAIFEIRAGAGGDEAALFAAQLFDVYRLYAAKRGWKFEVLEISDTGLGGFKEASAEVTGAGVFARLKFESGVHRVQRVPKTEASGRIHTSTVTVAVLPEAEEVDVKLDEKDLKIETMRSGGAGGQHVNKTESAVRMTHLPTGVTVHMQEEKSQIKNRAKALKIIRAKLYEMERQRLADERATARKDQVGTGDRSERIRTYNFPQSRVTDHRINHTSHQIDHVMTGAIDEFIDKLIEADEALRLAELGAAE